MRGQTYRHYQGFTIVELLIVIIVIGILSLLVFTTFSGVQARARDTKNADTAAKLAKAMEVYHAEKGMYPTELQLSDDTWVNANFPAAVQLRTDSKGKKAHFSQISADPAGESTPSSSYNLNIIIPWSGYLGGGVFKINVISEKDKSVKSFNSLNSDVNDGSQPYDGWASRSTQTNFCPSSFHTVGFTLDGTTKLCRAGSFDS